MRTRPNRTIAAFGSAAVFALLLLSSGCLVKETRHTLYLSPDGAVSWTVLERDVRSDHADPVERDREEREYLDRVRTDRHLTARALDSLWPRRLETVVLRDLRPLTVHTAARYADAARMVEHGLRELDLGGDAWIEQGDGWSRLQIEVRVEDLDRWESEEQGPDLLSLLIEADRFEIRLTDGEFLDARGFDLRERGQLAVPLELDRDEVERNGGIARLTLTWSVSGPDIPTERAQPEAERESAEG